jgi:hypothetical protein
MADEYPRVTALIYRIDSGAGYQYGENSALDGTLPGFVYRLRRREAVFSPTEHFGTEADARAKLQPLLRAWELSAALQHQRGVLEFNFLSAQIQREAPRPAVLELQGAAIAISRASAILTLTFEGPHPSPPAAFATDEFVLTLVDLALIAQETPRVLLYIAYSATTCVLDRFGDFRAAATALRVAPGVFDQIKKLSNTMGVGAERRKGGLNGPPTPIPQPVREWLLPMLREIARRAGAAAAGAAAGDEITLLTHPLPK